MPDNNFAVVRKTMNDIRRASDVVNEVVRAGSDIGKVIFPGKSTSVPKDMSSSTSYEQAVESSGSGKESSGYVAEMSNPVPEEYLVTIENNKWRVTSVLQETLNRHITSEWEPFVNLGGIGSVTSAAFQAVTKRALMTRMSSRRIWKGTSPIQISLTLKFRAVNNALREVSRPLLRLQQMALPSEGNGTFLKIPLLSPPGPSPFKVSGDTESGIKAEEQNTAVSKVVGHFEEGDNIDIYIGTYVLFENVIIKDVSVDEDIMLTEDGIPISAQATVTFETYEIFTKEKLEKAYRNI